MPVILVFLPASGGGIESALALTFVGFCAGWVIGLVQPNALLSAMSVPGTDPAAAAALIGCMQILGGAMASFAMPLAARSLESFVVVLGIAGWAAFGTWGVAQRREAEN